MIYFIAPYSKKFLGASRKIELLLGILSKTGQEVVLINTWYDPKSTFNETITIESEGKPIFIRQVTLSAISKNRLIYSFARFNILRKIIKNLIHSVGKPDLIWLYNNYFFESYLAVGLKKLCNSSLIFELEDWHFSRSRSLNPKPYLDSIAWKKVTKHTDYAFAVNESLFDRLKLLNLRVSLLPGLISDSLVLLGKKNSNLPFSRDIIDVGYFGGITKEKGGEMILYLLKNLPTNYRFIVTGVGDMEAQFKEASVLFPNRFHFYGMVEQSKLTDLMCSVDVILNPHMPINEMNNGVFPFKVMEAVASRKLILSTPLTGNDKFKETLNGITFIDYVPELWLEALLSASKDYFSKYSVINAAADEAIEAFSEQVILSKVTNLVTTLDCRNS